MSKEYAIPSEVKREAEKQAKEIGVSPNSIHHIFPKSLAKKYNLPHNKIVSIALLGLAESDFDARNIRQTRIHRSRKKKIRRSRRRR
jgi:antitoxin component of RelBE/YafQ-DinJ toxin-antitoxin module